MDQVFRKAERARLQQERNDLLAQRRDLEAQIALLDTKLTANEKEAAPFAPVYSLPNEILLMILKMAFQHHFPHCRLDDGSLKYSSAAISRVSRRWRQVALSEPLLWNCIHVTPYGVRKPSLAEFVKLHLVWSGDLPISFIFSCHEFVPNTDKGWNTPWAVFKTTIWPYFAKCWRYLLTQRKRWKNAVIISSHSKVMDVLLKSLRERSFFSLEYLSVSLHLLPSGSEESRSFFSHHGDLGMPALRRLWVANHSFWDQYDMFKNLSELKLEDITVAPLELLRYLEERSSALTSLILTRIKIEVKYNLPESLPKITLPKLKFLALELIDELTTDREDLCIAAVICNGSPSLETLLLNGTEENPHSLLPMILAGKIMFPTVRTLCHIAGDDYWDKHDEDTASITPAFVRAFPNLEVLETTSLAPECFVVAMSMDEEAGGCAAWPALHTVKLIGVDENLYNFVQHRIKIQRPLHTVYLNGNTLRDDCIPHYPAELEKLGIKCPDESYPQSDYGFEHRAAPYWDYQAEAPLFVPWDGGWEVHDQWARPRLGLRAAANAPRTMFEDDDDDEDEDDEDDEETEGEEWGEEDDMDED